MPECGSQVILCGLPIRFDTYRGCSHGCKYCFVQRKFDINSVKPYESVNALVSFIQGERTQETSWCDWKIPLHWGGVSDPFQPAEATHGNSLKCLKILCETQYPFVVSTKGYLVVEAPYLEHISNANCVVQISAVCEKYDVMEPGAPSFVERLLIIEKLSKMAQRVIVRIQPYMCEVFNEVKQSVRLFAEAGAFGIVVEGMKFLKKKEGLVKVGADYIYKLDTLKYHFSILRQIAHENMLRFYVGENRLRGFGDDLTCCGIDGLPGFRPNDVNICHMVNGAAPNITDTMRVKGTAMCFKAIDQKTEASNALKQSSFIDTMLEKYNAKPDYYKKLFGK